MFLFSSFSHELLGERIELAGYMTSSMPRAAGAATYSVDGGTPVPFEIPAWTPSFRGSGSNESIMRYTLFTTPKTSPGLHTLELVNQGNASTVPLPLHYFVVHHGDLLSATGTVRGPATATKSSTATGLPSGSQSGSLTSPQGQKNNIGIIVGVIVGMLVLIGAAVLLFFWIRRNRGRKAANPSLWSTDETVALNQRPPPFPIITPYRDAPGSSVSSELNPPHYAESELSFNSSSQHHLAHYPQQTVAHYEMVPQPMDMGYPVPAPQQVDLGYSMAAPQQVVAGYSVAPPQQMIHGHPVVAPPPQQSTRYPHITPFVQTADAPSAPLPRRLPPEKQRLNNSRSMESTSAMPSSSSSHSHGTTQPSAPSLRNLPPPLPPLERSTDSPASWSSSLHSQTRATRAEPPRVPTRPPPPPRKVPPRLPPSNADLEPPVYHE